MANYSDVVEGYGIPSNVTPRNADDVYYDMHTGQYWEVSGGNWVKGSAAKVDAGTFDANSNQIVDKVEVFVSAELTGTGSEEDVAHGMDTIPSKIFVSITDDNNAAFSIVEGTHDATNLKINVTLGAKYKVMCFK